MNENAGAKEYLFLVNNAYTLYGFRLMICWTQGITPSLYERCR